MIVNSDDAFGALASRDRELAETISILPTFLRESRATLRRVERFSANSAPVVRGLQPVADDLAPTVRDLRALAPDLKATFRALDPLITRSRTALPALTRTVAAPGRWWRRWSRSSTSSTRSSRCSTSTRRAWPASSPTAPRASTPTSAASATTTSSALRPALVPDRSERPADDRGHAYLEPNFANRLIAMGGFETTDCSKAGRPRQPVRRRRPNDAIGAPPLIKNFQRSPVCLVAGPSRTTARSCPGPTGAAPR